MSRPALPFAATTAIFVVIPFVFAALQRKGNCRPEGQAEKDSSLLGVPGGNLPFFAYMMYCISMQKIMEEGTN